MSKQETKSPQGEITDAFTGESFSARSRNHYEVNDGVPFAPHVDMPRPTVRQRVENLLTRGIDPLAHYIGSDDYDLEVPDDPEEPLTPSESNFIDHVASQLAEAAPLPDEGLPRPDGLKSPPAVQPSPEPPQAPPGQVSSPAPAPAGKTST